MISSDDLEYMRAYVDMLLPDTCEIEVFSRTSDGAGGFTETWTAIGTVDCRFDPAQTTEQDVKISGKDTLKSVYQVSLPYNCGLTDDHRISYNGKEFQILQIDNQHSNNVSIRARVARFD